MALTAATAMHHHLQRRKHPRSSYTSSSSGTSSPPPPSSQLYYYVVPPSTSRISSFVPSTVILHHNAPTMATTSNANYQPLSATSSSSNAAQNPDLRKRQRRQAAGNLVSGLFGNAAGGGGGGSGREGSFTGGSGAVAPSSAASPPNNSGGGGKAPGTTGAGRKSTAQPRPSIHIPPRGIGPVYNPNSNDVLCGRGGRINAHSGNVQFRDLVQSRKFDYLSEKTKKLDKAHIASSIVRQIREMQPPGRFLKEDPDGSWFDIGDAKAIKKVGQALREDAPDIRGDAPAGSDDDEPAGTAPIMTVVPLPPVSSPPVVVSAGTTVSARGGRVASHGTARGGDPYLVPSGPAGAGGGNFSGAAAAAVQDAEFMPAPLARDMAFGCQFHMTDPGKDGSMISGLSFVPSGMSGVSALTDPSVLGGTPSSMRGAAISNSLRVSQLKHLRQQLAAQQQHQQQHQHGNSLQSDGTATRMLLSSQNGLGSSLQASSNFMGTGRQPRAQSFQDAQSVSDAMSWAEHSLVGGGIAGANAAIRPHHQYSDNASVGNVSHMQPSVSGQQSLFGANMSVGSYSMTSKDDSWIGGRYSNQPLPLQPQPQPPMYPSTGEDRSSNGASSASRTTAAHYNTYYGGGGGNGGDRSVHSGGEESVSMQSILSNLSENLIALDLAGTHGTSLLDQL